MKKILLRVMPLAAAIVFATSCSKDKDEVKPEDVTPKESSVTMTFKVGSSAGLSKIGLIEDNGDFGVALKFDGNEVINFTDAEGRVTGSVTHLLTSKTMARLPSLMYRLRAKKKISKNSRREILS